MAGALWSPPFIILTAGLLSATLTYNHTISRESRTQIARTQTLANEISHRASERVAALSLVLQTAATAAEGLPIITREATTRLSTPAVEELPNWAWWEAIPFQGDWEARVQSIVLDNGFTSNHTAVVPRILLPDGAFPIRNDPGSLETAVPCGPLTSGPSPTSCIPFQIPTNHSQCILKHTCLLLLSYWGAAVPLMVEGDDILKDRELLLDLSRLPSRSDTISRALRSQRPTASHPVLVVNRKRQQAVGLSLWAPVFTQGSTDERPSNHTVLVKGFFGASVLSSNLRAAVMKRDISSDIHWTIYDVDSRTVLMDSEGSSEGTITTPGITDTTTSLMGNSNNTTAITAEARFEGLGRTWAVRVGTSKGHSASQALLYFLILSVLGFAFAILYASVFIQARLKARAKMEAVSERVRLERHFQTQMLAFVHHALRSPLHILTNCLEEFSRAVGDRAQQQSDGRQMLAQCTNALGAAAIMTRHVNDMLDLTKLQRGEFSSVPRPVDIFHTVRRLVHNLQPHTEIPILIDDSSARSALCTSETEQDEPVYCVVDPDRLEQLLTNGLTNAIKHTNKGSITVSLSIARRQARDSEDVQGVLGRLTTHITPPPPSPEKVMLHMSVKDTGEGLKGKSPESFFTPFTSEIDHNNRTNLRSTGLGLPLARTIARALGGDIELRDHGSGCSFLVALPVALMKEDAIIRQGLLPSPSRTISHGDNANGFHLKVLIVEDMHVNARLATKMLRREHCVTAAITTGPFDTQVFRILSQSAQFRVTENHPASLPASSGASQPPPYDLLLLDVKLGHEDGVQILQQLISNWKMYPPHHKPRCVAMTAAASESDKALYESVGFNGIIAKPFTLATVHSMLRLASTPDSWDRFVEFYP